MDGGLAVGKSQKTKQARKRAKRKKIITIAVTCIVIIAIITAAVLIILNQQSDTRVYALGVNTITLSGDGTFDAQPGCAGSKSGTFSESLSGDVTIVSFTHDGMTANGRIVGNVLTIPDEWDDGHGHGTEFTLR